MSTARVSFSRSLFPATSLLIVCSGGKLSANQDLGVKVATPVGTLMGQLLFGWLADVVGRKKMCKRSIDRPLFFFFFFSLSHRRSFIDGVELMIIIVATFGQALSGQAPAIHIIGVLVVWRFLVSGISSRSSFQTLS